MTPIRVTFEGLGAPQAFELRMTFGLAMLWQLEREAGRSPDRVRRLDGANAPTDACPDCKGAGILYDDTTGRGDFAAVPCARCAPAAR